MPSACAFVFAALVYNKVNSRRINQSNTNITNRRQHGWVFYLEARKAFLSVTMIWGQKAPHGTAQMLQKPCEQEERRSKRKINRRHGNSLGALMRLKIPKRHYLLSMHNMPGTAEKYLIYITLFILTMAYSQTSLIPLKERLELRIVVTCPKSHSW